MLSPFVRAVSEGAGGPVAVPLLGADEVAGTTPPTYLTGWSGRACSGPAPDPASTTGTSRGARYLVGAQQGDGHWSTGAFGDGTYDASDVVDTAWAILFLARATRPLPAPLPPVTPGG